MKELLRLARKAISCHLSGKKPEISKKVRELYSGKKACFVTLTEKGRLRGCIGSLYPKQALYKDVIENAVHAAFEDYRFDSARKDELKNIKIEISVLSIPKKISFKDENDLLNKIDNGMGIILKKGVNSATFLPQVWKDIPGKADFLQFLSMKAGLDKDDWKTADIYYYTVESIKEE